MCRSVPGRLVYRKNVSQKLQKRSDERRTVAWRRHSGRLRRGWSDGITDGLGRQRSDCSVRHSTLSSRAGGSLRKPGLSVSLHEMLKRRGIAKRLGRGPVAGCEVRIADKEEFGLCARLVEPAQLGKACGQETA